MQQFCCRQRTLQTNTRSQSVARKEGVWNAESREGLPAELRATMSAAWTAMGILRVSDYLIRTASFCLLIVRAGKSVQWFSNTGVYIRPAATGRTRLGRSRKHLFTIRALPGAGLQYTVGIVGEKRGSHCALVGELELERSIQESQES